MKSTPNRDRLPLCAAPENETVTDLKGFHTSIPSKHSQPHLVYGKRYHVWKNDDYLGIGVWSQDYVGPYFENFFESTDIVKYFVVYKADRWELA